MPSGRTGSGQLKQGRARLRLLVHLDAVLHSPRAYGAAAWWRFRGKRVRARARFAPLLSASRYAYRLWLLDEESAGTGETERPDVPIVAVIDGASGGDLRATLRSLEAEAIDAVVLGSPEAPSPAEAANLIQWNDNPWLMPLKSGDVLAPGAGNAYRRAAAGTEASVVYADDDLLDGTGSRIEPHFKPGWNSELFRYLDFLTGACILRASSAEFVELGTPGCERLVAAAAGKTEPVHLPFVLHHRLARPRPHVPQALVVQDQGLPKVTVIVPTRNGLELLRTCLMGVERTNYPDLEVIVVDNESDDPDTLAFLAGLEPGRYQVLRQPGAFNFSTLNNRAARQAGGHLLCLLNNDIEVIAPDWLRIMASQAGRPDVGAVGAQLIYPDGRIQHAGVVLGVGGGAAHAHRLIRPGETGYFRRHALPQFVSAVTAACLVVRKERFMAVGGLDEEKFAVAFNDVDLCMRLNQRGWQSLYEPRATLIHHESVSRGFDRDRAGAARLARELAALKAAWGTGERVDPFHHVHLSPFSERFVVGL